MKAQGLGARGGTETEEPGRRWSGSREGGRYWASPQKTVSVTLVAPVQPLRRPLAQIQGSMPWTVLLGCSPFPKGVWTQLWGGGWRRPALALAGERLQEPGLGAALEDSGSGPLPPAPRHPSGGPAQPGPRPSSGPKSRLRAPSLPHPGMLQGEVGGLEEKGCCFLSPAVACSPTAHRGREAGPRALEASRVRREQKLPDVRLPRGIRVLHNHCWPQAPPQVPAPSQPGRASEGQASPSQPVSKPCGALPGAQRPPKGQLPEAALGEGNRCGCGRKVRTEKPG